MTVEVNNISLRYNGPQAKDHYILKDLSLTVNQSEFVCLLGPSGCGKSSLLGLVAGFVRPTNGSITVNDKAVTRPDINRTLVFQEYALFPWLNVIENVAFGLKYKIKDREERFLHASRYLKMVGLIEHAKDNIFELSGGMKQRVAIARALAVKPDLLLMDEPFGALDDQTRVNMQEQLIRICNELKPTVIFVTHSVDEALKLADKIVVMTRAEKANDTVLGEIKAIVDIPASRPRSQNELTNYRSQVMDALYGSETNLETGFDAMI